MSQSAKDGLKERVDGLYAKAVIVVQDKMQGLSAAAAQLIVGGQFEPVFLYALAQCLQVRLARGESVADTV